MSTIIHDSSCFPFPSIFRGAFKFFSQKLRCGHDMDGFSKLNPIVLVVFLFFIEFQKQLHIIVNILVKNSNCKRLGTFKNYPHWE
jgi:hypothetical protein